MLQQLMCELCHLNHRPLERQQLGEEEQSPEHQRSSNRIETSPHRAFVIEDTERKATEAEKESRNVQNVPTILPVLQDVGPHLVRFGYDGCLRVRDGEDGEMSVWSA